MLPKTKTCVVRAALLFLFAVLPSLCFADNSPAWVGLRQTLFPAHVTSLNFPDYRFLDTAQSMKWGKWTVSRLSSLRLPVANRLFPCGPHEPGTHVSCELTLDQLTCRSSTIVLPCQMMLEYDDWIDEYDCRLAVAGRNISMRYCPEVQLVVGGNIIGPRSFRTKSDSAHSKSRWITIRNDTTKSIEAISVAYNCCGSIGAMWAVLLSVGAGDKPLDPAEERVFVLPRSLISSVPTKDPNVSDRDQIDLSRQCLAEDVVFRLGVPNAGQLLSENLGRTDLCKIAVITVRP